jgi:hypothetical protein
MLYLINKSSDNEKLEDIVGSNNNCYIHSQFENDFGQLASEIKTSPNLEDNLKLHRELKENGLLFKITEDQFNNFITQ